MRLATYESATGPRVAALSDDGLVDLNEIDSALPSSLKALLAAGDGALERARTAAAHGPRRDFNSVRWRAPIVDPEKIICVGLNYADHARESGMAPPAEPVIFNKFPSAAAAHEDVVSLPTASSEVDYEAELVVVIGRGGRDIAESSALDHVAGYCPGNDVSARDWQLRKPGGQWLLGKSFDGFAPFGPALVTRDEIPDPERLRIALRRNGETLQDSSSDQFIFSIPEIIAYVSSVCTLAVGDVIFTGTPPGVGFARRPPVFLEDGDFVEVEIERLGTLRNRFRRT